MKALGALSIFMAHTSYTVLGQWPTRSHQIYVRCWLPLLYWTYVSISNFSFPVHRSYPLPHISSFRLVDRPYHLHLIPSFPVSVSIDHIIRNVLISSFQVSMSIDHIICNVLISSFPVSVSIDHIICISFLHFQFPCQSIISFATF